MKYQPAVLFGLLASLFVNISSAWFSVALITPVLTNPLFNPANIWFLTKSIGFGIVYFAVGYWIQTRREHDDI